jgi:uncharacterized protein YodC (DUF2158 family)
VCSRAMAAAAGVVVGDGLQGGSGQHLSNQSQGMQACTWVEDEHSRHEPWHGDRRRLLASIVRWLAASTPQSAQDA